MGVYHRDLDEHRLLSSLSRRHAAEWRQIKTHACDDREFDARSLLYSTGAPNGPNPQLARLFGCGPV